MGNIFTPLLAKIFAGVSAFAIVSCLLLYIWGDGWRDKAHRLMSENALIRIDLQSLKTANEEATKRALAEKAAQEALDAKRKEESDAKLAEARKDARAAAARYAANNRVRPQTAPGGSGCTNLSGTSTTAGGLDGPCPDAEYVALGREDFDILIDNTIRLKEAADWAKSR